MESKLTVKQAIEEGFTKCGYYGHDWQSTMDISDFSDEELQENKIMLFSKESNTPSITAETIKDLIANTLEDYHYQETNDDTNGVTDIVNALDFEATAEMVNDALKKYECYTLTDIQVIPNVTNSTDQLTQSRIMEATKGLNLEEK